LKEIEKNFYFRSVYQTIAVLRINWCTRSSSQFQKGWWPLAYTHIVLEQGSQIQIALRAKWGLTKKPEDCIMTQMQQRRYLNFTGNSFYTLFTA